MRRRHHPAPVYNWTGWYVGLNAGVSFGRASADVNYFAPTTGGVTVCNTPAGTPGALCINGSDTIDMNGPIGGVQLGYNWQNGNFLAGIEADFQGSGQSGTHDFVTSFSNGTNISGVTQGPAAGSVTERMPWLGTVRGRVGYEANQWLAYATGGLAYGRIEVDSSAVANGIVSLSGPIAGSGPCSSSAPLVCQVWGFNGSGVTKIGWTVGAGAELALGGNWTAKFEWIIQHDIHWSPWLLWCCYFRRWRFLLTYGRWLRHDQQQDHRQHRARRAELSISLI